MTTARGTAVFELRGASARLGAQLAVRELSLELRRGEVTAILGPNGSGKSTLLRLLSGSLRPTTGAVLFEGDPLEALAPKAVARRVAYLPQSPIAPVDLTVGELAWRGRYPHRRWLTAAGEADRRAVETAMSLAEVDELADRTLGTLSGGERQRAWVALALAQEPDVLLLDEPTTFLDIGHQADLLRLLARLNRDRGLTVVMVLHDLSQAAHAADRVIGLHDGAVVFDGAPTEVLTAEGVSSLFGTRVRVMLDPDSGRPVVLPALDMPATGEVSTRP